MVFPQIILYFMWVRRWVRRGYLLWTSIENFFYGFLDLIEDQKIGPSVISKTSGIDYQKQKWIFIMFWDLSVLAGL